MRTTRRLLARLTLVAVAGLVGLAACDDPTGPGPVAGRYTLRLVSRQPVPALVFTTRVGDLMASGSYTLLEYVDGGILVLLDAVADTLRVERRSVVAPDGGTPAASATVEHIPFRLQGERQCVDDAFAVGERACNGPRVRQRGDSLFLDLAPVPFSVAREYAFVREGR